VHQRQVIRINDFALKLANVNGTGSASANGLLMQAIFRMGIPVSGKNLFPSNIQGLPTWYEVRVSKHGHTARALDYDLMIAMNAETYARDIKEVRSGGAVLYDSSWPLDEALSRPEQLKRIVGELIASRAGRSGEPLRRASGSIRATPRAAATAAAVKLGLPSRMGHCFAKTIDLPSRTAHRTVLSSTNVKVCGSSVPSLSVVMISIVLSCLTTL